MVRAVRVWALAALVLGLAGCGRGGQGDAAEGAARFLAAVQARDRVAFEAAIDRQTVREDLRRQVTAEARAEGLDVEGGPSDLALDRRIAPDAFRLVQAGADRPLTQAPTAAQLAGMMHALDRNHACLQVEGRCRLTFGRSKKGWRLVRMESGATTIPAPPP